MGSGSSALLRGPGCTLACVIPEQLAQVQKAALLVMECGADRWVVMCLVHHPAQLRVKGAECCLRALLSGQQGGTHPGDGIRK